MKPRNTKIRDSGYRILLIARIIAIACMSGMLLCYKLWLSDRTFPLIPVFDFLPNIYPPFDIVLFLIAIILLVCIVIFCNPQKFIIAFICIALVLALLDWNRWQPWFYQYVMMLFVLSFYNTVSSDKEQQQSIVTIFKLMIAAIYFWSGLQKLNPHFLAETFPWLIEPVTKHLEPGGINRLRFLGYAFPFIETITGIALLINPLKKYALILALMMHLFILFVVGPFGHNYNPVVWPWNIAMMSFNIILFYNNELFLITDFKKALSSHSLKMVTLLFVIMPVFSFFNLWDSYLSHNLYSGNTSNCVVYISDSIKQKLPDTIKPYALGEVGHEQIVVKYWCMNELGVPPYPEEKNFRAIANTFYKYEKDSSEVSFVFIPKAY